MITKKILIVDDEPDLVELASYNLKKEGFTVFSAADGEEALQMIRGKHFDLIVLDLMLPGLHGIELCRILKNNPKTENIPFVMLTAESEAHQVAEALKAGVDNYIIKPFTPDILQKKLAETHKKTSKRSAA